PRGLCDRLRHRGQPADYPAADGRFGVLRPQRGAARADHDPQRSRGADEFPRLSGAAIPRGAERRDLRGAEPAAAHGRRRAWHTADRPGGRQRAVHAHGHAPPLAAADGGDMNERAGSTEQFYDDLAPFYHLIYEDWERAITQQGAVLAR